MKSVMINILISTILASASAFPLVSTTAIPLLSPTNVSLSSNLPDPRFKIRSELEATLLPVNAALLNILYFMGTTSIQNFDEQLAPRTYSAPGYRQVEIQTYAWTETRFLLWGIYLAIIDMVKQVRFHNTLIELYWEDKLVGRMKIAAKTVLSLSGIGDDLRDLLDMGGRLNQTISNQRRGPVTPGGSSAADQLAILWNVTEAVPALIPAGSSLTALPVKIQFSPVAGATIIGRNSVFLTFFAGLLHIAQFRPDEKMKPFQSDSRLDNVHLQMAEGKFFSQVITLCFMVALRLTKIKKDANYLRND